MPTIDTTRLPARPDLPQERKRAKELLRALRGNDAEATSRLRTSHPRFAASTLSDLGAADLKLSDAQLVIAREYGFPSWPALKASIEQSAGRADEGTFTVLAWNKEYDREWIPGGLFVWTTVFKNNEFDARNLGFDFVRNRCVVCGVYDRLDEAEAKMAEARELQRQFGGSLELTCVRGQPAPKTKSSRKAAPQQSVRVKPSAVRIEGGKLHIEFSDGRELSLPLAWFAELMIGSEDQRHRHVLRDNNTTICWPELGLQVDCVPLLGFEQATAVTRSTHSLAVRRAALADCSRAREPLQWAKAQAELGDSLLRFGFDGRSAVQLEQAVSAYRAALEEFVPPGPQWWRTLMRLGLALMKLADIEGGTSRLEESVTAFRTALAGMPPDQQHHVRINMFACLMAFGEHDPARFAEAAEVLHAAPGDYDPGSMYELRRCEALAWMALADRRSDLKLAQRAQTLLQQAAVLRQARGPEFWFAGISGGDDSILQDEEKELSRVGALIEKLQESC